MIKVLYIESSGEGVRLTPDEARQLAAFCYDTHDHTASHPQPSIFWWREKVLSSSRMN